MKLGPLQNKWIAALRSGKYKQGKSVLRTRAKRPQDEEFCCLGVALKVMGVPANPHYKGHYTKSYPYGSGGDVSNGVLPPEVTKQLGLRSRKGVPNDLDLRQLTELNDTGKSFEFIADTLEAHPSAYFKESK